MSWIKKTIGLAILSLAMPSYAVNPQPEWYAGLIVGANYAANVPFTYVTQRDNQKPGQLGHDIMGTIGGQVGYRWCDNFRLEFEGVYNNSPYAYLRLNHVTVYDHDTSSGLRMTGQTQSGLALFNFFYDIFGDFSSDVVPYVGLGVGYAYIDNKIEFYYNDEQLINYSEELANLVNAYPENSHRGSIIGQAIAGVSYYLDDFAYFGLDVRYATSAEQTILARQTERVQNQFNAKYQIYSLNIIFNGAFDAG